MSFPESRWDVSSHEIGVHDHSQPQKMSEEQLFDLAADPLEQKNLSRDPLSADILNGHRTRLEAWEAGVRIVDPGC
jgi:hypothetical protein